MWRVGVIGLGWVLVGAQLLWAQPSRVQQTALQAARLRKQAQQILSSWQENKAELLAKQASFTQQRRVLAAQLKRLKGYLSAEQAKIAALEAQLAQLEELKQKLEPLVFDKAQELKQLLEECPSPAAGASQGRLRAMMQTLNDYDASVVDKTRALLVALEAEARQGIVARATEAEVSIEGRPRQVQLLVVGRVGVFALGMGGSRAWVWDKAKAKFVPADGYAGSIKRAIEMAARRRVVELVELPIGPAAVEGGK